MFIDRILFKINLD